MEKNSLKTYLSDRYQGWDSFCDTIVIPIFGKDNYEDKRKKEVLDMQPERRHLADVTGIRSVKFCGHTYVSGEPLQFFDITVSDKVLMDRNRVNVQKIIRSVMDQYSSAFMIFHYEDETKWEWRFSFFYKQGKNKDTTSAKRFTYLFGQSSQTRTASERFAQLADMEKDTDNLLDAFSVEARGYILKPYNASDVFDVLERICRYASIRTLTLKIRQRLINIPMADIMYVESNNPNITIHCLDNVIYTIRKKLDVVEADLNDTHFLRCHKSYLVNMDYITAASDDFVLTDGTVIPIRKTDVKFYKEEYKKFAEEHK